VAVVGATLTETGITLNGNPLVRTPLTVTTTLPEVAPTGTVAKMKK